MCKRPFYYYRMRLNSALHTADKDISIFKVFNELKKMDNEIFTYGEDFYTYNYFKYHKLIKKLNIKRISLYKTLSNHNISKRTKILSVYYFIVPYFIRKIIKKLKYRLNQLYE